MSQTEQLPAGPDRSYHDLWVVAWPVILYSLLQWLVGAVDECMVGRLGKEALSAVGMSRQIIFLLMIVMMAVSTGTMTLTAQAHGAGDRDLVNSAVRQGMWMALVVSAVMGTVGFVLAGRLLQWMGAPPKIVSVGAPYMRVWFAGMFLMVTGFIVSAAFRGVGDTVTPLWVSVIVNLVNVPANYVLIFGKFGFPALGVTGAAWGTILSRVIGFVLLMSILLRGRGRVGFGLGKRRCFEWDTARRILRVGIPAGGQGVVRNGARVVLWRVVAESAFKVPALAAFVVGMRFRMISIMLGLAFQTAAASVVGQRIGAGDLDGAERAGWAAVRLSVVPLVAMAGLVMFFAPSVVAVFSRDPEVVRIGATLVRILAVGQIFTGMAIALGGTLTGAGDTKPGFFITGFGQWFVMLPLAAVLLMVCRMDPHGVWIGLAAADILQFWLYVWRFRSGAWRRIEV